MLSGEKHTKEAGADPLRPVHRLGQKASDASYRCYCSLSPLLCSERYVRWGVDEVEMRKSDVEVAIYGRQPDRPKGWLGDHTMTVDGQRGN
jgi:hypothetical protein